MTVQGPVKKQQPNEMSQGGGGALLKPKAALNGRMGDALVGRPKVLPLGGGPWHCSRSIGGDGALGEGVGHTNSATLFVGRQSLFRWVTPLIPLPPSPSPVYPPPPLYKPRPCPSYSRRRDCNNCVHWRSLYKGGGLLCPCPCWRRSPHVKGAEEYDAAGPRVVRHK